MSGCRGRLAVFVTSAACASAIGAIGGAEQPRRSGEREHATVRLVSELDALRPGEVNNLGLLFTIDDGWHIYWNGVNDSGIPPRAEWTAPRGFEVEPMLLPVPTRYVGPGDLLDHVYEKQVLLIVPVMVPEDATPGAPMTFRAGVEWLVCKEACLPGYADVMITLPVASAQREARPTAVAPEFEKAMERVPVLWDGQGAGLSVHVSRSSVEIEAPGATRVAYYPQSEAARAEDLLRKGVSATGRLRLRLHPSDRGQVDRDPVVRFVVEAKFPGEASSQVYLVERPLSELGG